MEVNEYVLYNKSDNFLRKVRRQMPNWVEEFVIHYFGIQKMGDKGYNYVLHGRINGIYATWRMHTERGDDYEFLRQNLFSRVNLDPWYKRRILDMLSNINLRNYVRY